MKKLSIQAVFLLLTAFVTYSQTNLVENWDGNGDVNTSTSYPDQYGWAVTTGFFNYANSGSGIRWYDVSESSNPVHMLNGSPYTGRLLMVRWDGSGGTDLSSVYSYPVSLGSGNKYKLSFIYEWWNNASAPILSVGIGTDASGGGLIASGDFACSGTRNLLQEGGISFYVAGGGDFFLTIGANNLAALCAIGELSLIEVEAALESSVSSIVLNYYESEKTFSILPNGSEDPVEITAPAGIGLSSASLPSTGGEITVFSADSSDVSGDITISQGTDMITVPVTASFPADFFDLARIDTLNTDGAWCWFNDPRAIYYKGAKEQTYLSWVNSRGDIMIASYDHGTGVYTEHLLYPELQVDDHDNPAIFIRKDGRLVVYFSRHTDAPAHRFISTNPEDITAWGSDYPFGVNVTYPYPFQVGDSIYIFYRGLDWHPTLVISADDGETLGEPRQFIAGGGDRPYARYCQDSDGTIHMAFTTAHPREGVTNRIYYAQFKNGKFYKADGTFIKDFTGTSTALNIDNNEPEVVYDASEGEGWIWDITVDENNHPVMVFAAFPSNTDHRYRYARWTGTEWFQSQVTGAGKWFPQTPEGGSESEPNYSGGIILDYDDPSTVYLSKEVKGVFEIFRFTTPDGGANWDSTALTWDTPPDIVNVRPIVPRHHRKGVFDLVWMRGKYVHYQNYHTSLVYWSDTILNEVDSIRMSVDSIDLKVGFGKQLSVTFFPFITTARDLSWSSSDESTVQVDNGLVTGIKEGTATVTATSFNGKTTTCVVSVSEPEYLTNAFFDFGLSGSPVAAGAIQVTENTLFTDSYGWTEAVLGRDRGAGSDDELRDFNMSATPAVFTVLVQPDSYHVIARQGDYSYTHDQMNIYVNDELRSTASNSTGTYSTSEFDVVVDGNTMEFRFEDGGGSNEHWVINSLKLEPVVYPPELVVIETFVPPMSAFKGETDTETIHLTGEYLEGDIILTLSGTDPDQFSVSPDFLPEPEAGILTETAITITYHPDEVGTHSAELSITTENADNITLTLTGTTETTGVEVPVEKIRIYTQAGKLFVTGTDEYRVYDLRGVLVADIRSGSGNSPLKLEPGVYVVRMEGEARKVVVE